MRSLIEPAMAALAVAASLLITAPQDAPVCEHVGRGVTTPADIEGAMRTLSELERSLRLRVEEARPPRPPELPRCAGPSARRKRRADLPGALEGKSIVIESPEGASAELLRLLEIRCWPTEVRFLPGGEIEWVER